MKLRNIFILILIIIFSAQVVSYAVNVSVNKVDKTFFTADKLEVGTGDSVMLTLDLSSIKYDSFIFDLTSDAYLNEIDTKQKDVSLLVDDKSLNITGDKSKLSVDKIYLNYTVPNNLTVGTKITLIGTIKENIIEKSKEDSIKIVANTTEEKNNSSNKVTSENIVQDNKKQENIIKNNEKENKVTNTVGNIISSSNTNLVNVKANETQKVENNVIEEVKIIITVIDPKNEIKNDDKNNEKFNEEKKENEINKVSTVSKSMQSSSSVQLKTQTSMTTQVRNTFNGESNNYLSSLEIEGYEITPKFNKVNDTYFIDLDDDITSINIKATAEDSNAKVTIYGNDDLKNEENKILISVTAENGDVKVYRIYVK